MVLGLAALLAGARSALADPILRFPPHGNAVISECPGGPGMLAMVGEVVGIGVLGAERLTTFPDYGTIKGNEPELGLARVGLVGVHPCRPLAFALRADFSEALRIDSDTFDDHPAAVIDRVVDDAAVWWTPRAWVNLVAGRHKVPFSRFRQLDRGLLSAGAAPFLVDRIAPDRRWGATISGDLGAAAYALGGYADSDALELRAGADDPSTAGRALVATHVEWTPRAPIGADHYATPASDPWYSVVRVSAGMGFLWRLRRPGVGSAFDLSLNGQLKYRRYAAVAEVILSTDAVELSLGGAGELSVLLIDKVVAYARGDYDAGVDLWSVGGGLSYFVTDDRRNKVSLFGFVRRDTEPGGTERDGVIAQLQAFL